MRCANSQFGEKWSKRFGGGRGVFWSDQVAVITRDSHRRDTAGSAETPTTAGHQFVEGVVL